MTQRYKLPVVVLLTSLASLWLGVQLASSPASSDPIRAHQSSTLSATNSDSEKRLAQLQQQVNSLQEENRRLNLQLQNHPAGKATQQSELLADTSEIKQLKDKIDALEIEQQQRKASDINSWIMNKQKADAQFDLNNELAHRFEQESTDTLWAEKQEHHYRQLFSSQENLRDFALRSTHCRSTQCEVTFSTSNPEQSFQLLQAISNELHGSEILVATDETQSISKLYISRNQKGFELN